MDIKKAQSAIKAAMICGILSTSITLIATAIAIHQGQLEIDGVQFNALMLVDVGLLTGLTIGLYFKSRVAAVTLFAYFLWAKVSTWSSGQSPMNIMVGVAFLYFYFQGMRGTFIFHKLSKQPADQQP